MNNATRAIPITGALLLGLLALALPAGCGKANSDGKPIAAVVPSQLAQNLIGTWVHAGRPGQIGEPPAARGRLKFRTGRYWTLTHADPDTGLVTEHFGGTYTVNGNEYVETQDYADSTWIQDNGKSFKFTVKVEGDTMTQVGIGNPYTEVWKRAK